MVTSETEKSSKQTRLLLIVALIVSMSVTAGSLLFVLYRLNNPATTDTGAAIIEADNFFDGTTAYDLPRQIADFSLTGNNGHPLGLADLKGKVTLLYFGYTHCPDFCPATLTDFGHIKQELGDNADRVNFLMISVDGVRDTPDLMQNFLAGYDADFLGMTGSAEELSLVGSDFGLYFSANEGENYTVDHTASIFMIDQEGFLRTMFAFGTEPEIIVENVKRLLDQ